MRQVEVAEHAGFCFGVKRAVDILEGELDGTKGTLCTWGPIIHNETVVDEFRERGVRPVESVEEVAPGGTVVIRAHGVSKGVEDALMERGVRVVDATCPFVKRIHELAQEAADEGRVVIVAGDPSHPEVAGVVSRAGDKAVVVESPEDAMSLEMAPMTDVTLLAQTTFRVTKFQEIVEIVRNKGYNVNIVDTICKATGERQQEAAELASKVDAMVVIGGSSSSNTRKLAEICGSLCPQTYLVHAPGDLPADMPDSLRVGITAGASTPQKLIEEVTKYVRSGQEFHGAGGGVL